ncbi:MAG TPA: hypothetical protein VFT22_37690 [Kofleriaceae bacterium]|nr:hypothetical protein [Kofleriaceae bacterium]
MTGPVHRRRVNAFLVVFLIVIAIDGFHAVNGAHQQLKDALNTPLVITGLWQGPWRLYGPEVDKVNLQFKAEVVFADQAVATWTSPAWSERSPFAKFVGARHMNYFGYLLKAGEPAWDALCIYLARTVPHPQGKPAVVIGVRLFLRAAPIPPPDEARLPAGPYVAFKPWEALWVWRAPG